MNVTEQDLVIQELRAENAKLKERLEEQSKPTEPTDMDKLTTEMMEHICDNICMHPIRVGQTQDELDDICAECKMGKFVCNILNTYNRLNEFDKTQSHDLLKKLSKYRNLEEQGLLLKVPVPLKSAVYSAECGMVVRDFVVHFTYDEKGTWAINEFGGIIGLWGSTVFATEQEAQSALEKMKGE